MLGLCGWMNLFGVLVVIQRALVCLVVVWVGLGGLCSLVAMLLLSGCGYLIVVMVYLDCVCCYSKCVDLLSWCLWWWGLLV